MKRAAVRVLAMKPFAAISAATASASETLMAATSFVVGLVAVVVTSSSS